MNELLRLKCRTCGVEFIAGIQVDRGSFATATLENNTEQCPAGHRNAYSKPDYFFG